MDKIIKVNFEEGWKTQFNNSLTQEDFGLHLQIEGITLPDGNVEVHFSLTEHNGEALVSIGTVKDNVITVEIPDFILAKENVNNSSYKAYAWIYVTDGESGRTIRKIVFTINTRAEPTTNVPEDQKDQFLQEVRQVLNETKEVAQSVRDDADAGKFNGKDGKDGKDGESGTSEIDEEQLLQFAIKSTTDKAPFHHITDSANYRVLDFGMEGKTEQNTVPGNQLFDKDSITLLNELLQNNGIAVPNTNYVHTDFIEVTPNETYTMVSLNSAYVLSGVWMFDENKTFVSKTHYNIGTVIPENVKYIMFAFEKSAYGVFTEAEVLELSESIMLVKGSTKPTTYEPYVGGIPSPNPEHEEEVKLAGVYNEATGRYEHKCCVGNKNLFDKNWILDFSTYDHTDGAYSRKYFYLEPNTKYRVVMFRKPITYKNAATVILGTVKGHDNSNANGLVVLMTCDLTTEKTESVIFVTDDTGRCIIKSLAYVYADLVELVDKNEIMIYKYDGVVDDTYVPYQSQPFTLTSDRPLTKWDKLVKRDGVWGWSVNSCHDVITGDAAINASNLDSKFSTLREALKTHPREYIGWRYCNMFKTSAWGDGLGDFSVNSGWVYFHFYEEGMTVDDCKARLNETPMEIWCWSSEEVAFIPLPEAEQTLLNNLETYYGVTNVYNEQGCPMWLEYVNDTKLYVDKKLLEIQQAMI